MSIVATDPYALEGIAPGDPAGHATSLTPSDTDELVVASRAILASADTTVKITMKNGDVCSAFPLQKGYNPLEIRKLWATGTTLAGATIWALW